MRIFDDFDAVVEAANSSMNDLSGSRNVNLCERISPDISSMILQLLDI